jgi:hypothetical protein
MSTPEMPKTWSVLVLDMFNYMDPEDGEQLVEGFESLTAPGVSWPEAYYLTWLPGVERWLVTASRDSPDIGGYNDSTLGYFEARPDPIEGAGQVIGGYWCDLMIEYDQQHWEVFFEAGMVDRATAEAWADEVWKVTYDDEELEEDEECQA